MTKQRLAAIDHVAATFLPAKIATDAAALEVARTVAAMMEARQDADLPFDTGLMALARLSRASSLMIEARQELIRAHGLLDRIPAEIGVPAHAFGKDAPPMGIGIPAPDGQLSERVAA